MFCSTFLKIPAIASYGDGYANRCCFGPCPGVSSEFAGADLCFEVDVIPCLSLSLSAAPSLSI